jgi:large subunit ribosomal protein L20
MRRVKRGASARFRRQKILSLRKRAIESNSYSFRIAKQQVIKSINFSYVGRKDRKHYFRSLWSIRINRALLNYRRIDFKYDINYRSFIYSLRKKKCLLNRKVIAQIALIDPFFFQEIIKQAIKLNLIYLLN